MSLQSAVVSAFSNYAKFTGRASLPEYWFFYLFIALVSVGASISEATHATVFAIVFGLVYIAAMLPAVAVATRRLHDVGKSGWNQLWALTGIGAFYVLYLLIKPGQAEANSYGSPREA